MQIVATNGRGLHHHESRGLEDEALGVDVALEDAQVVRGECDREHGQASAGKRQSQRDDRFCR